MYKIDRIVNPQWERDYCCCPTISGREVVLKQIAKLKQRIETVLKEEDNPTITAFQKGLKVRDFLPSQLSSPILQQRMDRGISSASAASCESAKN